MELLNTLTLKEEILQIPKLAITETIGYMWLSLKITAIPFSLACLIHIGRIVWN